MQNLHGHSLSKATATVNWKRRGLGIVFSIAVTAALGPMASAQLLPPPQNHWTITDLGVVSTISGRASGDTGSRATAINASGTVVGYSCLYIDASAQVGFIGCLNSDGFIWTPDSKNGMTGTINYIGGLPGSYCFSPASTVQGLTTPAGYAQFDSVPFNINSSGQAVGYSYSSPDGTCPNLSIHGALYENGKVVDLGIPSQTVGAFGAHYGASYATSINDTSQIVGWAQLENDDAWIYGNGSYTILGQPPSPFLPQGFIYSFPNRINNSGTLVGTAYTSSQSLGFKHTGTGPFLPTDLIGTLGGPNSSANGINEAGMVVGVTSLADPSVGDHAYVMDKFGAIKDLGTASQDPLSTSVALAINNTSLNIVGQSDVDPSQAWMSCQHAVMWQNADAIIDLNQLLDPSVAPPVGTPNSCSGFVPSMNICGKCWELISATGINDLGQIVGEGIINGQHHAYLLTPPCINDGGDSDGDGLCDDWEKNGYTDPKTGQFIDLPHMGADPKHKDIFVQADYMVDSNPNLCNANYICDSFGHSHKPNPDAINMLINAFANAPVENPDGTTGINIHIDCGPDCIMNPDTGQTWGQYSRAFAIEPEIEVLGTEYCPSPVINPDCDYDWTDFDDLKSLYFTPTGRTASFHYMIFAHSLGITSGLGPNESVSGLGRSTPNSDFVISLGGLGACQSLTGPEQQCAGFVGNKINQAANFMHELGHNLGLRHGGLEDLNFKPNYLSIMNYFFNQNGLIENGTAGYLDYSRFPAIPALDEFLLKESVGLNGGPAIANYGTTYSCFSMGMVDGQPELRVRFPFVMNANGPIDWSCDGTIEPGFLPNAYDIDNRLDSNGKETIPPDPLTSSEDWSHLIFTGGDIGALSVVRTPPTFTPSSTERPVPYIPTPYLVEVVSPGLARVVPGVSLNLTFTITNTGTQPDTYNLTPVSQLSWWNTSGVPATITLASGASQQIVIPVTVPASLGCSNLTAIQARFSLGAASQTYAALTDSGVAELDLVVSPGTSPVPSVTGLTESEAQAAILAAGFVAGTVTTNSSSSVPAGTVISQTPFGCGFAAAGAAISLVVSAGPALIVTPNVVGGTQVAAVAAMRAAGLNFGSEITVSSSSVPVGDVVSQNPPAGTEVTPGTLYSLVIASATPVSALTPSLIGAPISAAMSTITAGGFNLGLITQAFSLTVPDGTVISQVPAAGSPTSPGSYINLTVSYDYSQLMNIPNIAGDTQAAAISAILMAGYSVGSISEVASSTAPVGTVILQSPLAGLLLSPTTPVSFSISTGPVGPQSFVVPNVNGLAESAASSAITVAGLTVGTVTPSLELSVPVGVVFSQTPQPGAYAAGGSAVNLQVSAAPAQFTVPDLVTKPTFFSSAYADILGAGLTPGTFTAQISSAVPSGNVISQSPAPGSVVAGDSLVNVTYSMGIANNQLPGVVGENQVFATGSINSGTSGFSVSITREPSTTVPDGFVISQNPVSNPLAPVPLYQVVNLVVSSGGPVAAAIPNVVGTGITGGVSLTGAEPTLNAAGFAVGTVTYQPSNSVPAGVVVSQNPPAGTIAAWDSPVSLVYSSGPPTSVTMPNIVGKTQAAAFFYLAAASLKWTLATQSSQTVPAGVVISQNPSAGTVMLGTIPGPAGSSDGYAPVAFVVSAGPNTVPTYSLLTQFGDYGGPYAGDGQFYTLLSLAIDPKTGNILAGDLSGRIQIFDRNGNFKAYFGGNGVEFFSATVPGTNQLATVYPAGPGGGLFGDGFLASPFASYVVGYPVALAVDPINGNVVALDAANRVLIFNSAGVFQTTFGSTGQSAGQFSFFRGTGVATSGVAIDPVTENILVADWGNNRVQIFSSTGVYQGQFGTQGAGNGQFGYGPMGIAVDPETRNIAVMDTGQISGIARVEIFNSSGAYLGQFGPPVAAGACWAPVPCGTGGLVIDPTSHNIIVQGAIGLVDGAASSIQIFDSKGNYLSQFGGFGVSQPGGLALDPASHHIVTIGLAGDVDGTVQIFGAPVTPTPTSTALASSHNPAAPGQSVTFTATVTGTSPTGTVQFYYGGTTLGAPVPLAAGMASIATSSLPIGTDSITAVYSGDGSNSGGTSAVLSEIISPNPSTTTVGSSLNPGVAGQNVTFTATVTGSSPTGTVEFLDGAKSLGAPVALISGVAAFTTSSLPVGTDPITAVYSGDGSNATSSSSVLNETVSLAPTATAVLSSAGHLTFGQSVTFTAVVTGDGPTGVVQFLDGATSLAAPVALTGNVASLTTSTLALGTHSITAMYKGDAFNSGSTSPILSEFVSTNAPTSTSLVASTNPLIVGNSVTFSATVAGSSPSGTIQFMDGVASLGSPVALAARAAAIATSALSVGTHSIAAVYSGDTANGPSTSTVLSEVVSPNTTIATVTSSQNPANVGQFVTFMASVAGGNPTGPVQFRDGTTKLLKPVALSGGKASITVAYTSSGTHPITAAYFGDENNSASTSPILNEVISAGAAPPVVTPPAAISIPATQAGGATSGAWPALAAFLAGATATSTVSPAPIQLAPEVGGLAVTSATLFPTGTTTVTFQFKDNNGNIGSATSTVTVAVGTPRITGSSAGVSVNPSGAISVKIVLTNTGTGNARNLKINTLVFRTLSGTGTITYNAALSPSLPLAIGNLDVGASVTTVIYVNVPSTVTRMSITESGPVQDVVGTSYNYSTAEAVIP
jgi:beta-lactam-binding protein with PASTA domain